MCISPFFSSLPFLLSLFNINTMEEVAEILSGQYGIRQVGKSAPMLASKPSTNTALSSSNTHHSQQALNRSLEDLVAKGGNNVSDDPFLIFDKGFSTSDQFSFKPNAIQPSLFVDESDFFNFDGNPRDVDQKKPLMTDSTILKPPSLENFDFFKMYESGLDQKEVLVNGMGEGGNESYSGIDAFFSGLGLGGSWETRQMDVNSDNIFGSSFESQGLLGRFQGVSTPSKFNLNESSFGIEAIQSCTKLEDVGGDNDYRRRARYAREVTKFARAERALAEKNERDFNMQREQNEKERFSEELDREIKQWAAGREGNLRALLSTLHCILWPECGWQPMSLGNLMTSSAVKKAYGKAALCIHPDKVQQKGSNLRQKYVAEKVFYLLTGALNKFSSEELK